MNFILSNIYEPDCKITTVSRYFNFLKKVMKCDFFYTTTKVELPFF